MSHRPGFIQRNRKHLGLAMMVALLTGAWQTAVFADDAAPKFGNALDWVPADAAVFSSTLRLKEQVEIVANSKAWAKFKEIPSVKQGLMMAQMYWTLGATEINQTIQKPENQQLIDLVLDLLSHEIVMYADQQTADLTALCGEVYNSAVYNPSAFNPQKAGNPQQNDPKAAARGALKRLSSNLDRLKIPTIVFAFKHTDAARAKAQLDRLEKVVKEALAEEPKLKDRFKRSTIGGNDYLTLTLDGKMVPWDEIPADASEIEEKPGQLKQLIEKLKTLEMVISLGVRGDYLLFSLAPSTAHLAALGTGARLVDREEFQPIYKLADQRLVGVSFESKEAAVALASHDGLDNLEEMIVGATANSGMPAETRTRLSADLNSLKKDLRMLLPEPGATLTSSVLTERGYDCYTHNWGENLRMDGSKPLDIMQHLGGTPLVAVMGRTKVLPQDYLMSIKWLTTAHSYFEELALPTLTPEQKRQYHEWMEFAKPLLARLNSANITMLQPAMADGQHAFVLDAKITSRRWFTGMPQESPLPMIEPALVYGVSDADLLKKGVAEYRAVADEFVEKLREKNPESVPPDFKIPDPQVRSIRSGTIYSYPLPRDLGIDGQLAPGAGLGPNVAVLTISPKHTAELLSSTPFEAEGPASDAKQPLAAAAYVDCAGLVEASTPWIEYAVRMVYVKTHEGEGVGLDTGADRTGRRGRSRSRSGFDSQGARSPARLTSKERQPSRTPKSTSATWSDSQSLPPGQELATAAMQHGWKTNGRVCGSASVPDGPWATTNSWPESSNTSAASYAVASPAEKASKPT